MINSLPELVLLTIFNYFTDSERICILALVCRKWYHVVHSGALWKEVNFDYQRKVTPDILDKYIYAGTRKVLLSECCYLKWKDICAILRRCKRIEVLIAPWIGYNKETVPDITRMLNIHNLTFLELSHCKVTNSLFNQIPVLCPFLNFFLLQDCQEITEEAYMNSNFKTHEHLKVLNVAGNKEALSSRSVIELLKYNKGRVFLDIRGHQLTQAEFAGITKEHSDAMERVFEDVDDYAHMFPI